MNFLSRTRIAKIEQASDAQPGMLETMIKRLYIRRFPQLENLASSVWLAQVGHDFKLRHYRVSKALDIKAPRV